jgi:hypothetical protein
MLLLDCKFSSALAVFGGEPISLPQRKRSFAEVSVPISVVLNNILSSVLLERIIGDFFFFNTTVYITLYYVGNGI